MHSKKDLKAAGYFIETGANMSYEGSTCTSGSVRSKGLPLAMCVAPGEDEAQREERDLN